jgi:tetratricopeptide (TPR) repeat protein
MSLLPTTILMLSANPKGTDPLRLDEERREVESGLMERSRFRDSFRLVTKTAVRPRDFQRAMLDLNPQIVHFSGHGGGEPGLVFENDEGKVKFVDGKALAGLFELFADLQCVVLNACYSEAQAEAIAQHIPYVIGMNAAIGDRAAIDFAVGFYDALGAGRDIEFAYSFARSAIQLAGIPEHLTPVLLQKPLAQPPALALALTTYDPDSWVGRQDLITFLTAKLQGSCRLLLINGLTGIGKTALAECLAVETVTNKATIRYGNVSFDGMKEIDFISVARRVLEERLHIPISPEEAKNPDALMRRLVQTLTSESYWLQLDSLEVLLEDDGQGSSRFADERVLELFRQVLMANSNSRFVLTSQEIPSDLEALTSRYSNHCLIQPLSGLDKSEQLALFQKILALPELDGEAIAYLQQTGQAYEGHPLVLQVIAGEMKAEPFRGNVKRYWQAFQSGKSALQSRRLERQAFNRVRESLERLPIAAQQMLCACSVFRRPVPVEFWLAMVENGEMAFDTLRDRYLVEWDSESNTSKLQVRQHNLVQRVANEKLREDAIIWEQVERQAAQLWLTIYEPEPDLSNLEKVRGYLEAFYHLCAIEDWERASEIYTKEIPIIKQPFHWQLLVWGYYQELIYISLQAWKFSQKNCDWKEACVALGGLGFASYNLGEYLQSIDYYQQRLCIAREIGNRLEEASALGGLGLTYYDLGEYQQAIDYYQQRLSIAREVGNLWGEGSALGGLGLACYGLGHYQQSVEYHLQALTISRGIGDRRGEGQDLGNLGIAYGKLGKEQQAIDCTLQYLTIAREVGDRRGEGIALDNLGEALIHLKRYSEALEKLQLALEISEEIGDRTGEAYVYKNLATLYQQTGRSDLAREFCQKALILASELGIPLAQDCQTLKDKLEEEPNDSNGQTINLV